MTEFAVHFGIDASKLDLLKNFPSGSGLVVNGDGWNCWNEAPGADINDENSRHIVMYVDKFAGTFHSIVEIIGKDDLVPLANQGNPVFNGSKIVVTDVDNHSDIVVHSKDLTSFVSGPR